MIGPVKAYKGVTWHYTSEFGDRFSVGETYTCKHAKVRTAGFHACLNPWHVLDYYTPYESRFLMVDIDGDIDSCDHMLTGTRMTVVKELSDREFIESLVAQRDYRIESFDAVLSEEPHDCIWGERHGLVVQSTGSNAFIRVHSDTFYALSTGDKASILVDRMCMNSLILSLGDDALIESGGSSRIVVHGTGTEVRLTGSNHVLCLAAGTVLLYGDRMLVAGEDFSADAYYVSEADGRLVPMDEDSMPVKDEVIIN